MGSRAGGRRRLEKRNQGQAEHQRANDRHKRVHGFPPRFSPAIRREGNSCPGAAPGAGRTAVSRWPRFQSRCEPESGGPEPRMRGISAISRCGPLPATDRRPSARWPTPWSAALRWPRRTRRHRGKARIPSQAVGRLAAISLPSLRFAALRPASVTPVGGRGQLSCHVDMSDVAGRRQRRLRKAQIEEEPSIGQELQVGEAEQPLAEPRPAPGSARCP